MDKLKKIITFLPLLAISLTSCSNKGVHYEESKYMVDVAYKDNFKILQLSDIHLGQKDDLDLHYSFMDLSIKESNPDFIMLTGDLFTFANRRTMNSFFDFLDSYKIPWGVTWGNHDEQCDFSISYMTGELNKRAEKSGYCKFIDLQDDDVFGYSNYVINLKDSSNKIRYQFYSIDSNRYYYGDYMGYDYIHQDQIDWYERMVNYSTNLNSGTPIESIAFYHIPVPEFQEAWDLYKEGSTDVIYHSGENREAVCCPKTNTGFFQKALDLGSTKGMFVGHDHRNNADLTYKGIRLVYATKSTDRIYYDEDMIGRTEITITDGHLSDVQFFTHAYEEVK